MYYLSRRGLSKRRYHFHFRWRIEIHEMLCENSEIPPTAVWWMVQIQPTETEASKLGNPTNGSWWMVQIQPTEMGFQTWESHQRQVGDGSDPTYRDGAAVFGNPTNGSWWMVQSLCFEEVRI